MQVSLSELFMRLRKAEKNLEKASRWRDSARIRSAWINFNYRKFGPSYMELLSGSPRKRA